VLRNFVGIVVRAKSWEKGPSHMSLQPKQVSVHVTPINFRGENARITMVPIFPGGR
jgi:hypothetical protein